MEQYFKKYNILFLVIILALAVFFRLYQLKTIPPGLYPDEAMNGNNALEAIRGIPPVGGLFINIQSLSVRIFGNEPWALRIVSAIFGVFTVLGLYFLTRELFNKESIALLASFFLATSFWHINFSRIGFQTIMAPFFLVWGLWLVWVLMRKQNAFLAVLAGFVFGFGFYSYVSYPAIILFLIGPVAMIFAALGFCWLAEKINRPKLIFLIFIFLLTVSINTYKQYFFDWAGNPNVALAFNENYTLLGNYLKYSPLDIKKYVIINTENESVQPVMFLTDTYSAKNQKQKNIYYILPKDLNDFIIRAKGEENLQIFMLKNDASLRKKLSDNIPGLFVYENEGILIQEK